MSLEQKKYFESGVRYEQERIIRLLMLEFAVGVDLETTEIRDAIILSLIKKIEGEQK